MPRLDPSNDYVFKILFKDPGDERRLIAMLTAILEPPVPIVSAKVKNPQIPADIATAKSVVLDLLVILGDGRTVDIEMEAWPRAVFIERGLYYWSRAHSLQLDVGENYAALRPTISIAWLCDPLDGSRSFVESPRVHTRYRICETTTKEELTDHLELHLLDLRKIATDDTLSSELRRWAEFFDHPTDEVLRRLAEEDEIMAETIKKLDAVSSDKDIFYVAEARKKGELMHRAELARERAEGKTEERRAIVARMLEAGIDRDVVAGVAGLSRAEVDAIADGRG